MADIAGQGLATRKGLFVTTSVAVVYLVSGGGDINWIVTLAGWKAWLFLLLAHAYHSVNWLVWRTEFRESYLISEDNDLAELLDEEPRRDGEIKHRLKHVWSCGKQVRLFVMVTLADILAGLGAIIAGLAFMYRFLTRNVGAISVPVW